LSARVEIIDMQAATDSLTPNFQRLSATTRWLDAHRRTDVAFDLDVPGLEPSWTVDVTRPHSSSFTVRATDGWVGYATTASQHL